MSPTEGQINVYGEQALDAADLPAMAAPEEGPLCTFTPRVSMFGLDFYVSVRIFSFIISFMLSTAGGRLKRGLWGDCRPPRPTLISQILSHY